MEITASLVKELRERTGAGMMECKKALTENNGDIEASIDWLRAKGLSMRYILFNYLQEIVNAKDNYKRHH